MYRSPRSRGKARAAVAAAYFVQGLCFAALLTQVPALKDRFDLSEGGLTLVLLAVPLVAAVGSILAGGLAPRVGSAPVLRVAATGVCVAIALIGLAAGRWQLFAATALFGLVVGAVDATMNMQGVAVQWWYGRSILASFHGVWSVAGITGALATAATAAAGVPLGAALGGVALVGAVIILAAGPLLVRPDDGPARGASPAVADGTPPGPAGRTPWRPVLLIGLAVMAMFLAESATSNWSAVYLRDGLDATSSVAALGVAAYLTFQVLGRTGADRAVQAFGPAATVATGGLVGAVGLAVVVAAAEPWQALVGFAVTGAGLCVVVPQAFSAAGALDTDGSGVMIARVNLFNYAGFVVGAALIGVVAETTSLRWAFAVPAVLVLGIVAAARAFAVPPAVVDRSRSPS
jgi:MFS family permease